MSFFCADSITAGYGKSNIIKNLSFRMEKGTMVGILGANGSGKTTLLKSVCGILPHGGTCRLEETVLEKLSPRQIARLISYVPQRSGITIDISAIDVVLMGFNPHLGLLEYPTYIMKKAAQQALEQVGLGGQESTNYLHFSEGQKQLCILARTLVSDARLLLLDEPESALDFHFRYHMLNLIRTWLHENQRNALITLHDPVLALNYCDKLLLLADGVLVGELLPHSDSLKNMEKQLALVYGSVNLQLCKNRTGKDYIVMLKEDSQ